MRGAELAPSELVDDLAAAWRLQQDLSQLMKVALPDGVDPEHEPKALRSLMAKAAGVRDFRSLRATLTGRRRAAHQAFRALLAGG
jgi:glutamate-ammonia-ligase adenylyltransferase